MHNDVGPGRRAVFLGIAVLWASAVVGAEASGQATFQITFGLTASI